MGQILWSWILCIGPNSTWAEYYGPNTIGLNSTWAEYYGPNTIGPNPKWAEYYWAESYEGRILLGRILRGPNTIGPNPMWAEYYGPNPTGRVLRGPRTTGTSHKFFFQPSLLYRIDGYFCSLKLLLNLDSWSWSFNFARFFSNLPLFFARRLK
jgi:hypothetical protein